jgi:FG-GAP repeat
LQDSFGRDVAGIGDIDGDKIPDVAISAPFDDTAGIDAGAVYICRLDADGTVISTGMLTDLGGKVSAGDRLGGSLSSLPDLDGNGIAELAIGAAEDAAGAGAVYIVSISALGGELSSLKISSGTGGFSGSLANGANFGTSVATLSSLDGSGVPSLAVGANTNSVWILFLSAPDGAVTGFHQIDGNLPSVTLTDEFGCAVSPLYEPGQKALAPFGDIAVGAWLHDTGGTETGAIWFLNLNSSTLSSTTGSSTTPTTAAFVSSTADLATTAIQVPSTTAISTAVPPTGTTTGPATTSQVTSSPTTTTAGSGALPAVGTSVSETSPSFGSIGVIIGIVVAVALCLVIAAMVAVFVARRRRRETGRSSRSSEELNDPSLVLTPTGPSARTSQEAEGAYGVMPDGAPDTPGDASGPSTSTYSGISAVSPGDEGDGTGAYHNVPPKAEQAQAYHNIPPKAERAQAYHNLPGVAESK